MFITIGDTTRKYLKVFGLDYPFDSQELKISFVRLIKEKHPDHGGIGEEARQIIEAYNYLKNLALNPDSEKLEKLERQAKKEEEDIFAIWDNCKNCSGRGYQIIPERRICDCEYGRSIWFTLAGAGVLRSKKKCRDCGGTGEFRLQSKRLTKCRKCKGTGIFTWQCRKCNNTGSITIGETKPTCIYCEGFGKVKVEFFNPVIRKGAILQRR